MKILLSAKFTDNSADGKTNWSTRQRDSETDRQKESTSRWKQTDGEKTEGDEYKSLVGIFLRGRHHSRRAHRHRQSFGAARSPDETQTARLDRASQTDGGEESSCTQALSRQTLDVFNALRRQNYSPHLMIRTSVYVCARAEAPPRKRTHAHAQTCIQTCTGAQTDTKLKRQKRRNWRMVVALLVKTLLACLFFLSQTYCFVAVN